MYTNETIFSLSLITMILFFIAPSSNGSEFNDRVLMSHINKDGDNASKINVSGLYRSDRVPAIEFAVATGLTGEPEGIHNVLLDLSENATNAFTLNYTFSGTATRNADYTNAGSLSVAAGDNSLIIPVVIIDDNVGESDETIIITLSGGTGYTLGTTTVYTLTIFDNEPEFFFSDAVDAEPEEFGTYLLPILIRGVAANDITINYSVSGTASSGTDYTIAGSGTALLDVSEDASQAEISIVINDDLVVEETNETIIITLTSGTGYSVGSDNEFTLTIEDNEWLLGFRRSASNYSENDGTARVQVILTETPSRDFTLNYKLGGTAVEGTDYNFGSALMMGGAGFLQEISVIIIDDDSGDEGDETIIITLETGEGYILQELEKEHTITLSDNEPIAAFTTGGVDIPESVGAFTVGVALTEPATADVTLNYGVTGTASANTDFSIASLGTALIDVSENASEVDIPIRITNDNLSEGDETIVLTLTSGSGYSVSNFAFILTIIDDELSLSLSGTVSDQTYSRGVAITDLVLPEATGGTEPYTYTLTPTTLPDGLSFDSVTRTISGTPTAGFPQTEFSYTATDAASPALTNTLTFDITVLDPSLTTALTLSPSTISDQSYTRGVAITDLVLPEASGGTAPYSYTLTPALPNGLRFTPSRRTIGGTPTVELSQTEFSYTATDAASPALTSTLTFDITVSDPAPASLTFSSSTISDQSYTRGLAITDLVLPEASGGTEPYTYTLTPTTLPSGLSFNPTTRTISGIPTDGFPQTKFSYTATDAASPALTSTLTFDITVSDPSPASLTLTPSTISDQSFTRGVAITDLVLPEASGGTEPYTYTLAPSLPSGLLFTSATRTINGTPTASAAVSVFTYTAQDADGTSESITFFLQVVLPEDLTFAEMVNPQIYPVKLPITDLILPEAMGGIAPYTYTVTPDVPIGLTFVKETRILGGTPSEVMNSTIFTYTAEDDSGTRIELEFSIEVYTISFTEEIQNQTYPRGELITPLVLPEISGGITPVIYSINLFSLPLGLLYEASTRTLSGIPIQITPPVELNYKALDANGAQDSLAFTVEVISPVSTEQALESPQEFLIHTNYPNPFLESTHLVLDIPFSAEIQVDVMDITGRLVHSKPAVIMTPGWRQEVELHSLTLPSGSYLYRVMVTSMENHSTSIHTGHFVSIR